MATRNAPLDATLNPDGTIRSAEGPENQATVAVLSVSTVQEANSYNLPNIR